MGGIQGDDGRKTKRAMVCGDLDSEEISEAKELLENHGFVVSLSSTSDDSFEVRCYRNEIRIGEFTNLNDLKKFLEKE